MSLATINNYAPFGFYVPILKAVESEEDGDWILEGPLSEPGKDIQGEEMVQGVWGKSGLRKGLETFVALGCVVDWEHLYEKTRDPEAIIGKGIDLYDAPHPVTGVIVPWVKVKLMKGQRLAQKAWTLFQNGGALGISVAGGAIKKAGSRILEPMITTIALTAVPVVAKNAGTMRLAKALEMGAAAEGDAPEGFFLPMVPELLAQGVTPLFRALTATGAQPAAGPGADALTVEDLGGQGKKATSSFADPEEEDEEAERKRRRNSLKAVRKALNFQLGTALADAMATQLAGVNR